MGISLSFEPTLRQAATLETRQPWSSASAPRQQASEMGFCQEHYQEPPEGTPKAYLIPVVQILQGYLTDCACKSTQKYRAMQGFTLFLTFFNNYSLRFLLRLLSCCLFSSSWLRMLIRLYSSAFLSRSFMNFSIEGISPA